MSLSKTIFAVLGTLIVGITTFFASSFRTDFKNKLVNATKKKSIAQNRENLFI